MLYSEALAFIHSRPRFTPERAGERMALLLARLGDPQKQLSFVHVTGTNGKGSFSAMTASMLSAAGKKTGLFISPYILEFRERIQCGGGMIPKETLARLTARLIPEIEALDAAGTPVNEFMTVTALGLLWFLEERCDIVVLEVGIGGFHDATNCIPPPVLSVIMGIGLDHQNILGERITDIARDKSGIIKGNPTLLYPDQPEEAVSVIMERCAKTGAPLTIPSVSTLAILSEDFDRTVFRYGDHPYTLPLIGRYQLKNAVTAITAGRMLGLPEEAIAKGIASVRFPARMELVSHDPDILIDGAHNVHGMTALTDSIRALLPGRKVIALVGMMRDKDFADALALLAPLVSRVFTVTIDYPRTASAAETAAVLSPMTPAEAYDDWLSGLRAAIAAAKSDGSLLLVCGSLYLAADVRRELLD